MTSTHVNTIDVVTIVSSFRIMNAVNTLVPLGDNATVLKSRQKKKKIARWNLSTSKGLK